MALHDEEQQVLSFPELFLVYCNFDAKKGVLGGAEDKFDRILLSQADFWMKKANLIGKKLTLTDTGTLFFKFKKWRLDYEEFREYLESICKEKDFDLYDIIEKLTTVGPPTAADMVKMT